MRIRQEMNGDHSAVYNVVQTAFASAAHRDGNEQDLVATLRRSEAFVPALSLVAELAGAIAGHILFTEARVGSATVLALAPLAVAPMYQKQGIGSALVKEGHRIACALGYQYSLVLGSAAYYPRFGYVPAASLGIEIPQGIPSAYFMAARLREDAKPLSGAVQYAKEFGI